MREAVVILHGIFRTSRSMKGLAAFLGRNGYDVLNINYPSTRHDISGLADMIHAEIKAFTPPGRKINFVAYSMGGLLARAYISKYRPCVNRVVMIATPNKGSEVADLLSNFRIYKKLYGPAGQQLITCQDDLMGILGKIDYELGIIAGNKPVDIISSRIIGRANDGKVSVESTMTDNMKDHIVMGCNHTYFPSSRRAWKQVLAFLANGQFER